MNTEFDHLAAGRHVMANFFLCHTNSSFGEKFDPWEFEDYCTVGRISSQYRVAQLEPLD